MTTSLDNKSNYIAEIIVAVGYVLFLCLLIIACAGFYYSIVAQAAPKRDPFVSSLPDRTPSPHISLDYQFGVNNIFKDAFIDNHNNWYNIEEPSDITVKDGKLSFGSLTQNRYATARNGQASYLNQPYYFQADFSVSQMTAENFGIMFKTRYANADFYLFEINSESKQYYLYHHAGNSWWLRMTGNTDSIQSYPSVNTIGIYVNGGNLEFYINHKIVDAFQDSGTSFQSGETGFYVDNSGFQLIVTNFFIDKIEGR